MTWENSGFVQLSLRSWCTLLFSCVNVTHLKQKQLLSGVLFFFFFKALVYITAVVLNGAGKEFCLQEYWPMSGDIFGSPKLGVWNNPNCQLGLASSGMSP